MKHIKIFVIIITILFLASYSYSQIEHFEIGKNLEISSKLIKKIKVVLPEDWKIKIQEQKLRFERKKTISAVIIAPSMPPGLVKPNEILYYCVLAVTEFISPDTFAKINKNNQRLEKEAELLYLEKKIYDIPAKKFKAPPWEYEYYPRTPEESSIVERYKYLYSQIQILPDYYCNDQSFFFYQQRLKYKNVNEEKECKKVTQRILELLNKYEK